MWIRDVQLYAQRMDGVMLEVLNSYADYYQAIGVDLMVTLPSAITDVFSALGGIVTAIENVLDNPLGVFNSITNAITV
jgi:hypothetical protein